MTSTSAGNMDVSDQGAANRKRHDNNSSPGEGATKKPRRRNNRNNNKGGGGSGGENRNTNNNKGGGGGGGENNNGNGNNSNRNRNRNRNRNNRNNNNNNNQKDENKNEAGNMEVDATPSNDAVMETTAVSSEAPKSRHQFSDTTFVSLDSISANSKRALTDVLNYEFMTKVQDATLPSVLKGKDIVAKAKTGSGKTTAFLLPIIEHLAVANADRNAPNSNKISAVILSPTRELANQISVEFDKLATFHPKMKSQSITMIGGTNIGKDQKRLQRDQNIRVLIATPGRLQDHLNQNTAGIVERLSEVGVLCLDEADRLLDMGFRKELERIMSYMPQNHAAGARQTLLFSATFPDAIKDITKVAMRPDYELIDTLDPDEGNTNVQVVQMSLVTPLQHHMIALEHVLQEHIEERTSKKQAFKIIVFFTTARVAGYTAELFRADPRYPHYTDNNLLEMHSRKSQSYRTNVAKKFTTQSNIIMFSSDVSARGVDYPDVTAVVQVGAPSEKAQYIHRLGRTARAGNSGVGILILSDFERVFLREIDDLDVSPFTTLAVLSDAEAREEQEHFKKMFASNQGLQNSAKAAYQAFLGYYNSNIRRLRLQNKEELVRIANDYAVVLGFPEGNPPGLLAKTIGKMGLKGTPGLVIDKGPPGGGGGGGRGGGGRGGGRGGGGRGGRGGFRR